MMTGTLINTYKYKDTEGNVIFEKQRFEPKGFNVRHLNNGDWIYNLDGISPMLYNLPKVVRNNPVFIVEGEKDVNNLATLGYTATSPPFGAGRWDNSFNQYFEGKEVYIIPDNDDVGKQHAETVAQQILTVTDKVKILDLTRTYKDLKEKGDVSDVLEALGSDETKTMLEWLMENTAPATISTDNGTQWQEIVPFDSFDLPTFPVETLPENMRDYVKTVSENLAVPIEMAVLSELAVIAVCLQGRVFVQAKADYKEPVNLYTLVIAEPGERKSPLLKILAAPLYDYEKKINEERRRIINEEKATIKVKQKQLAELEEEDDIAKVVDLQMEIEKLQHKQTHELRLTSDDFTVESLTSLMAENDGRMSVISSEGGMFNNVTGRYNSKASFETLLKAYTGDTIRVDRKSRPSEFIENPSLTILLMAQESVLEGIMDNGNLRGQGFLGRFLYCQPLSPMGKRKYETPPLNHDIIKNFHAILFKLLDIKQANTLKISNEAYTVSKDFFEWLEPRLVGELDSIRDWASKIHGTTFRIAGLLHCIENNGIGDGIISETTMKNAKSIALYFIEHAKKAFSVMGTSKEITKAKFVLRKLETVTEPEIKKRDLYMLCRSKYFSKAEDINDTLELLIEHGYIRSKKVKDSKAVGRKSVVFELNPEYFVQIVQNVQNI